MRQDVDAARSFCNLASFSGIAAIPVIFIGIAIGNAAIAAASLCWLVSHFVGYVTRMAQEDRDRAAFRLGMAEASLSAKRSVNEGPLPSHVSMN